MHAYEPERSLFSRLKKIKDKNLFVFDVAISDKNLDLKLYLSSKHQQGHTLELEQVDLFRDIFSTNVETQIVKTCTLDDTYSHGEFFDFIKIDIEGHELSALQGGRDLLRRNSSCILQIEIYPKYFDQVASEIKRNFSYIYRVFEAKVGGSFYLSDNVSEKPEYGYKNSPPTYICSNVKLEKFTKDKCIKNHGFVMNIIGTLERLIGKS